MSTIRVIRPSHSSESFLSTVRVTHPSHSSKSFLSKVRVTRPDTRRIRLSESLAAQHPSHSLARILLPARAGDYPGQSSESLMGPLSELLRGTLRWLYPGKRTSESGSYQVMKSAFFRVVIFPSRHFFEPASFRLIVFQSGHLSKLASFQVSTCPLSESQSFQVSVLPSQHLCASFPSSIAPSRSCQVIVFPSRPPSQSGGRACSRVLIRRSHSSRAEGPCPPPSESQRQSVSESVSKSVSDRVSGRSPSPAPSESVRGSPDAPPPSAVTVRARRSTTVTAFGRSHLLLAVKGAPARKQAPTRGQPARARGGGLASAAPPPLSPPLRDSDTERG